MINAAKVETRSFRGAGFFCILFVVFALPTTVSTQKTAVLAPDRTEKSRSFAEKLVSHLAVKIRVLDMDLSEAAYSSVSSPTPFNLTIGESKRIGSVTGSDILILVRSANQRRSAFGRAEYYEAFAVVYVVSTRTGRLIWWKLLSYEATGSDQSDKLLEAGIAPLSDEIAGHVLSTIKNEINESPAISIEEVPSEGSPLAKGLRPPVPYSRIKPEYPAAAALYEVTATVEALVDLDASGIIKRMDITRWAGFGLEESVEKAIRQMNWRPAERNGKALAMRFLLRYNFKKLDKDPANQ
ncbi:hypothetical protein BH20ACI2_BH20ACI2_06450 [soil metagenome]